MGIKGKAKLGQAELRTALKSTDFLDENKQVGKERSGSPNKK